MRLLPVWVLTVAGWVVSAAPGPAHTTTPIPTHTPPPPGRPAPPDLKGADLGPALQDLARRKRGNSKSNLPYSNYRPVSGIHRYRYPLYRKRSYSPQYDYQEDLLLPEDDFAGYRELEHDLEGPSGIYGPLGNSGILGNQGPSGNYAPSLFRERNVKRSQLVDNGYFTDDYYPLEEDDDDDEAVDDLGHQADRQRDYLYHLYNLPYSDLERINHMYEIGKRDFDLTSLDLPPAVRGQLHGVGRKTYVPSATERFYDAIDYIKNEEEDKRRKKNVSKRGGYDQQNGGVISGEKLRKLQNSLTSAAGRYWRDREAEDAARDGLQERLGGGDPAGLIRRKREAKKMIKPLAKNAKTSSSSSSIRNKRAFSDYFKWEKRQSPSYDDYLTREYFKSIARSVGQKKKRMAYAQFEANYPESSKRSKTQVSRSGLNAPEGQDAAKRSESKAKVKRTGYNLDEVLKNPSMLRYMQDKLKEAEEVVAREAEGEVQEGDVDKLISNVVVRLDALERMRGALRQLEELETDGSAEEQDRRKKKREEEEIWRKMADEEDARRKKAAEEAEGRKKVRGKDKRSGRRRLRRGDGDLADLFLGSSSGECPVVERLLVNCEGVSAEVGDEDQVFLSHCLRHEICYMCGSGQSVTGHECDAILSSGLEAACSQSIALMPTRSLDCLSAAGSTFTLLSDHSRYDHNGLCTQDPCVAHFLQTR